MLAVIREKNGRTEVLCAGFSGQFWRPWATEKLTGFTSIRKFDTVKGASAAAQMMGGEVRELLPAKIVA